MSCTFDVIIVGAGSAGCVLANRLSRNPNTRVLLLEAGGWDWNPLVGIPAGARKVRERGWYEWGDQSEPDPGLNGRRMPIPHGRIVGGSSSLNFMAVVRGEPAAFDEWDELGASGWSYSDVLPYFRECESWVEGGDPWRGGGGEVSVIEAPLDDPIHKAMTNAVRNLGYPPNRDFNGERADGFGRIQYSIGDARRASSSRAFLRPVLRRKNLKVVTGATVTKVLFDGKRAAGVEYERGGRRSVVRCDDRVVLSSGAINSPHLLMLSGVGPADQLKEFGIEVRADLPVGQGLKDHIGIAIFWKRTSPGAFYHALRLDRVSRTMAQAYLLKTGPLATLPGGVMGFMKSAPEKKLLDLECIIAALAPDADYWFPGIKKAYQDAFYVNMWLLGQKSKGEVRLASTDPMQRPTVYYNSLSHPDDLVALRESYRRAWEIGNTAELAPYRGDLMYPDKPLLTDGEIDDFIRATAVQLYHPACTCRMGVEGDSVLKPDLSVRGLEGLYVVDASAMPTLPGGGPNIVTMMMAAKAAGMWRRSGG